MKGRSVYDVMQAIREEWQPASGIVLDPFGSIFPPVSPLPLTDAELEKQVGISYGALKGKKTEAEYQAWLATEPSFVKKRKSNGVGGIGITQRDEASLEGEIPGVMARLFREAGKISFLGNGFSSVPLAQAKRYKRGELRQPPYIADYFDYALVREDLLDLKALFEQYSFPFPLPIERGLGNVLALCSEVRDGSLIPVKYFFGLGDVPAELSGTDLAINCHGPPASSLEEQVSILAPGGELYTNVALSKEALQSLPCGFSNTDGYKDARTNTLFFNILRRKA